MFTKHISKAVQSFLLVSSSLVFISCLAESEDHYNLDSQSDYIASLPEPLKAECLLKYDALRPNEKHLICDEDEYGECFKIFKECFPDTPPRENTNAMCQDGKDNDDDNKIDCDDPDCENVAYCLPEGENTLEKCTDGIDNDDDDLIDCEDIDCAHLEPCLDIPVLPDPTENTNLLCSDGKDNDGDGDIDCDDKSCENVLACLPDGENTYEKCTDGIDNDDDDLIDCEDIDCAHLEPCLDIPIPPDPAENTNLLCSDGKDNDDDGDIDCDDKGCENVLACLPDGENTHEKCTDGIDNDDDDLIDCQDIDCAHIDECLEKLENSYDLCIDGEDNDDDNLIDCEDPDCIKVVACIPDEENTFELCNDGIDNDDDDDVDCDDDGCEMMEHCLDIDPPREDSQILCSDNIDNDNDNDVDCDDDDCATVAICMDDGTVLIDVQEDVSTNFVVISDNGNVDDMGELRWYNAGNGFPDPQFNGATPTQLSIPLSGAGWGGVYMQPGAQKTPRDEIDLSHLYLKKLKFMVRASRPLYLKVHWNPPQNVDDPNGWYSSTTAHLSDILNEDETGIDHTDGQWHSIEYEYFRLVRTQEISTRLTIPFALFSYETGGNIEIRNLEWSGIPDAPCFTVENNNNISDEVIYCAFD